MGMPGGWELVLIVGVVVLLFGAKKIPELAKGLGKGIKDFKKAVKDDDGATEEASKEIETKTEKVADAAQETKVTDKVADKA
ncbi:MAG: twin-arginine translocase TatA/TatE family subunit [Sulfurovum sp.]|nr:twin-arginine translocase TatA/TatE family subunit [Sulfurovum sp.]